MEEMRTLQQQLDTFMALYQEEREEREKEKQERKRDIQDFLKQLSNIIRAVAHPTTEGTAEGLKGEGDLDDESVIQEELQKDVVPRDEEVAKDAIVEHEVITAEPNEAEMKNEKDSNPVEETKVKAKKKKRVRIQEKYYINPRDVTSAMSLARIYQRKGTPRFSSGTNTYFSAQQRSMQASPKHQSFTRLNRAEIEECKAKNLRYNCDMMYTHGHRFKKIVFY